MRAVRPHSHSGPRTSFLDDPIYFEANLVKSNSAYPYGYSPILAVRFRK